MANKNLLTPKMERIEEKKKEKFVLYDDIAPKPLQFRDMIKYIWFGLLVGLNIALGIYLYSIRADYFNINVDLSQSIAFGILILKGLLLVIVLVIDAKSLSSVIKVWNKYKTKQKAVPKIEGEEGYKRLNLITKFWFYWRTSEARKYMDKYHLVFKKLERKIGKIKGTENNELKKMKRELIKGILVWKDDFAIPRTIIDKNGRKITSDVLVNEEFLSDLHLDELYEDYQLKCVDSAERFVNGVTNEEIQEKI